MSIFVHVIVGELNFVETDGLLHPVGTRRRGIWVDVISSGDWRVSLTRHCPPRTESMARLGMTVWGKAQCDTDYDVSIYGAWLSSESSDGLIHQFSIRRHDS